MLRANGGSKGFAAGRTGGRWRSVGGNLPLAGKPRRGHRQESSASRGVSLPLLVAVIADELAASFLRKGRENLRRNKRVLWTEPVSVRPEGQLHVLVVEDEPAVSSGLADWLGQRQFSVQVASDLQTAIDVAMADQPDAILLDVKLGTENGLDLLSRLAFMGVDVPCVVLTAYAGPYDGYRAHELGVAGLIEKPSSPDDIAVALRRAVSDARACGLPRHPGPAGLASKSPFVENAMRLIQKSFKTKGLSLQSLASSLGVSPGHLGKTFRREMGYSVIAHIHQCRVRHAARLLRRTVLSVKEIADDCGYHGSSELHRHFRRETGQSPQGFRSRSGKSPI